MKRYSAHGIMMAFDKENPKPDPKGQFVKYEDLPEELREPEKPLMFKSTRTGGAKHG